MHATKQAYVSTAGTQQHSTHQIYNHRTVVEDRVPEEQRLPEQQILRLLVAVSAGELCLDPAERGQNLKYDENN